MAEGKMAAFQLDVARFNRQLTRFVHASQDDAEQIVYAIASDVLTDTKIGWPVDTGLSRAAWWGPRKIGPATFQIGNPMGYAHVIEFGGYQGVGPKTHQFGPERLRGGFTVPGGIYPRQRPAAPLRRALATHWGRMTDELKASHARRWGRS